MPSPIRSLLAAALLLAAPPAAAETVTFHFAPPVGARFVARELQQTELRIAAERERHTTAILTTVSVEREGGVTYVAHRYDEIAGAKEGEKFETPPQITAMKGSRLVHVLRPDGSLLRIDGFAELAQKALPLMQPKARESFQKMLDEGRQDAADRVAWYESEMLVSQTLELGRDYWFETAWPDEEGWTKHETLLRLGPWIDHPQAGRLLTVQLAYVPNALARVPEATRLTPRIASRFDPAKPGKLAPRQTVEGTASWWIDPATMMNWKLQSWRKVGVPVQVTSDLGVTLVTETKIDRALEPAPPRSKN